MQVAWHPEAKGEYDAEVEWYEARGVGLGDRFEAAVDDIVGNHVSAGQPHDAVDTHQLPLSVPRFPWYYLSAR